MKNKKIDLKFLDPEAIIGQLEIVPGSSIADFGCGSGFFSIALAQKTGPKGKVFSLDILPQALESVEGRAKMMGFSNIATQRVNLEKKNGSGMEAGSLDWVVLKDILFQNKDKKIILEEAIRVLKPGGKILIVEWKKEFQGVGPVEKIRVEKKDIQKIAEKSGFVLEKEIEAGNFHYALVLKK
jgi:ubiquinone/menaquinone biosynthesis C-methylase UbiE